uniref:Uncharacterized protein n=1 Tax=Marseillevirus LCMAC101 TaxID=2506602 RepID=A0A481YQI3_9VIRU|nr:MAG: uncharacterized protein LCMAC101_00900 [Marseillevirus LCMAC101]
MILISAYFYDRFSKIQRGASTEQSIQNAKNIAMIALIFIIIAIAILFLLFFGFQTRMVGVSAYAATSSLKQMGPERVSFSPGPGPMSMSATGAAPAIVGAGQVNGSFSQTPMAGLGQPNGSFGY